MQILYWFESIRSPFLDAAFGLLTHLGGEIALLIIAAMIFWCLDKKEGYYLLTVGFFGLILNQFLKILCRVPRPWVKDPDFTIVESAREGAGGYSFPSGHTQTSVGLFGALARWHKEKWARILCIALCVIVPVSRMYLGVHTPADVLVSVVLALALVFGLYPVMRKAVEKPRSMRFVFLGILACAMVYVLYVMCWNFPASTDPVELFESRENAFKMLGALFAVWLSYEIDLRYTRFDTAAVPWAQAVKVVVGFALVMACKELLKIPQQMIFGEHILGDGIRYFMMVFAACGLWPMTFRFFPKKK